MPTKNFRRVRKATVVRSPEGDRIRLGGYRPETQQTSDKHYQVDRDRVGRLPKKIDLRPFMTAVENQGDSNSCTANAMAGAYEYLDNRLNSNAVDVSRLFIYYNARLLDGDVDKDQGTYLSSCITVLKKYGACSEETWPFQLGRIREQPHDRAYDEATRFQLEDAERVDVDLDAMRSCLASGYPFAFGLVLFESFQMAGEAGIVPMPDPENERMDGGHAMLCVGYSDRDRVFIVRNSWGSNWGDQGYCYIPYDYMTNSDLNHDCWMIRQVSQAEDLSQDIIGDDASLFDSAIEEIVRAVRTPGAWDNSEWMSFFTQDVVCEEEGIYNTEGELVLLSEIENWEMLFESESLSSEIVSAFSIDVVEESYEYLEESYEEESEESKDYEDETEDSYEEEEESEEEDGDEEDYEEDESEDYEDETEDSYEEDESEDYAEESEDDYAAEEEYEEADDEGGYDDGGDDDGGDYEEE